MDSPVYSVVRRRDGARLAPTTLVALGDDAERVVDDVAFRLNALVELKAALRSVLPYCHGQLSAPSTREAVETAQRILEELDRHG